MEHYALVEADFQQYYHIDLAELCAYYGGSRKGFLRYARLFSCLPRDSRIFMELAPAASWSWRDETMAQILRELSEIKRYYYNSHRVKGTAPMKPEDIFVPDYVKKAAESYEKERKTEESNDFADIERFWKERNSRE